MGSYILSDANRFYVAIENSYGGPAPIDSSNRFAAFGFDCHQSIETFKRRDKTGARTYLGGFPGATRRGSFVVSSHLTSWDGSTQPRCGPLVQAAMGAAPELVKGLVVAAVSGAQIHTTVANGLSIGSAVSNGSEVRFVVAVADSLTFSVNVPFSSGPGVGTILVPTAGYRLGTQLPSVSIYDYWDPASSVSRLVTGAVVDKFAIDVKGDVHEMTFRGVAADVLDSVSGVFGVSGLAGFLSEPAAATFEYSIVDGQLGQVWLGSPLNQVFALTEASVEINNNLIVRNQDFGSVYPTAVIPGPRQVVSSFTLFAQSDIATQSLYAAAKTKKPISALLQLGQHAGQMLAIYLPNVVAELPLFQDSEPFLLWEFKNNLGQGVNNDEAFLAFA